MTQCFKDHPCDSQNLYENTRPIAECESHVIELYDCQTLVTDVPILTCEGLWRVYQREAEEIVAPGGVLIADPIERNRVINAAYARLWLHDPRFQWAGLAAFASKQVGCGLLHAAESIENIEADYEARKRLRNSRLAPDLFSSEGISEQVRLMREQQTADDNNPMPVDLRIKGEVQSLGQQQFQHVFDMMALGNTTLFLDIFLLHAFYKKRGLKELEICLKNRVKIFGHPEFPVLWPIGQKKLRFGLGHDVILRAFTAIETGNIAESVKLLADHEQRNILQPAIYDNERLVLLLRSNQFAFVTDFPSGIAQAIELTLTSQCKSVSDGRTIGFSTEAFADLSDINQRMVFVLKAASRFEQMLHDSNRDELVRSISEIASGAITQ